MKKIRKVSVFLAIAGLLFFILNTWFDIPITTQYEDIIELIAAILVALGILVDTGVEPKPLSWKEVLEKLKSPVAVGAIFMLIAYLFRLYMPIDQSEITLKLIDTIVISIFGFSVYNNPNARESLK